MPSRSRRAKKRKAKKARKKQLKVDAQVIAERLKQREPSVESGDASGDSLKSEKKEDDDFDVEFVSETYGAEDDLVCDYASVFSAFVKAEDLSAPIGEDDESGDTDMAVDDSVSTRRTGSRFDQKSADALDDGNDAEFGFDASELSNRKRKELIRPSMLKLKKWSSRPDLVEEDDVNAPDPYFLAWLKCLPNTVAVPGHWRVKRKYLQGKRGFVKRPFKLPPYIYDTGITKLRDSGLEKLMEQSSKQRQRQRARPKNMGSMNIAYDVLQDAIFKHQTKPENMTSFGDVYYEGKEVMETRFKKFRAGVLSDRLKRALGMTPRYKVCAPSGVEVKQRRISEETGELLLHTSGELPYGKCVVWEGGAGDVGELASTRMIKVSAPMDALGGWIYLKNAKDGTANVKRLLCEEPPPWLVNMQRFGPPPSYPTLKIPGLNAPIPSSQKYGFQPGQWGKPPVKDDGTGVYGDPFSFWIEPTEGSGLQLDAGDVFADDGFKGKGKRRQRHWGTLEKYQADTDSESESEDEETEEGGAEETEAAMPVDTASTYAGSETGYMSGVMTPDIVHLRKTAAVGGTVTPSSIVSSELSSLRAPRRLYQVLESQKTAVTGKFGVDAIYKIPPVSATQKVSGVKRKLNADGVIDLVSGDSIGSKRQRSRFGARKHVAATSAADEPKDAKYDVKF